MDIRKTMIPQDHRGNPITYVPEREFIYFKVKFNNFRDVSNPTVNEISDREEWDESECCLCLPDSYTDDGEETPLIIFCHGSAGRVCEQDNMVGGIPYAIQCVEAGYAVLDINGSSPSGRTMGCPEHLFAVYKAYRHAIKHYNLSDKVLMGGASMGGQTAINFACMFPGIVLTLGLFYPRLNIEGVTVGDHYCIGTWDKPQAVDRIKKFFRFPTDEYCAENLIGVHPYRNRSFVNGDGERVVIPPCPIKLWQGLDDQTVDPVMAEEFVNSVRRSGSYIEFHRLEGVGHRANDVMRRELVMWFNRFA